MNESINDLKYIPSVDDLESNPRMIKRFVFGTATSDDIDVLHEAIEDLQVTKKTFTHLLGRQIHVVQSALQNMHSAIEFQQKQIMSVRENLEKEINNQEKRWSFMSAFDNRELT